MNVEQVKLLGFLEPGPTGWVEGVASEAYHADRNAVNNSSLKKILKSPASFYSSFFMGEKAEPSDAMKLGSAVHLAILEPMKFKEAYVLEPDFGDQRSSKNRDKKSEWMASQNPKATFVSQENLEMVTRIAENIADHRDAFLLLRDGKTEISGYYRDPETGIRCKIRPDFFSPNLMTLVDLKTTTDCSISAFSKAIWNYKYHIQMAMYSEGISQIEKSKVEFVAFIAVEKTPPYEIAVYIADDAMMDKGIEDYRKALRKLKQSATTGQWTRYQTKMENISLPHWAFNEE